MAGSRWAVYPGAGRVAAAVASEYGPGVHARLRREDLRTGLLVAAVIVGVGTAVARDLDTRAEREARAAAIVTGGAARLHPEAAAALRVAQGSTAPEHASALAGLYRDPSRPRQVSVATAGEALRLGLPGAAVDAPAHADLVAAVRAGGAVPDAAWATPGVAGLVALEAGRAGRVDLVPMLVSTAVAGPATPDRLAAKWALERLGRDPNGIPVSESAQRR